jgi:predicted RNase H-like HicB family nuclease
MRLTSIVHREEEHYVALCPELDVVSQGETVDEAAENLQEACQLFLEFACEEEISNRLRSPVHVPYFEAGGDLAADGQAVEAPPVGDAGVGGDSGGET